MSFKTVRAKFQPEQITDFGYGSKQFKLRAVYSNNPGEDNQFSTATPSGTIEMTVSNPEVMDFFQHGKKYYVDFTECPEEKQV